MLLFHPFTSPFTHSPFPQHQGFIPARVDSCSNSNKHLSPSAAYIDPQVVVSVSCTKCLFTSPENFFISFPQPLFSSINNGNPPAKGGKHTHHSSQHREVVPSLHLKYPSCLVFCLRDTMIIVLWTKTRLYFFSPSRIPRFHAPAG